MCKGELLMLFYFLYPELHIKKQTHMHTQKHIHTYIPQLYVLGIVFTSKKCVRLKDIKKIRYIYREY